MFYLTILWCLNSLEVNFMKKYLLLALLLIGCGRVDPVVVDPKILPYFNRFTQATGLGTDNISGEFTNLNFPVLGQCTVKDSYRLIQIDPTFWANADDSAKEQLVMHELGHAYLLGHNANMVSLNGIDCPASIMYPYSFGDSICYQNNKNYYYNELHSEIDS